MNISIFHGFCEFPCLYSAQSGIIFFNSGRIYNFNWPRPHEHSINRRVKTTGQCLILVCPSRSSKMSFACGKCNKCFPTNYALKRHERTIIYRTGMCDSMNSPHTQNIRVAQLQVQYHKFRCTVCGARFSDEINLDVHAKKHAHNTDQMGKMAHKNTRSGSIVQESAKNENKSHMTQHAPRNIKCSKCNKRFKMLSHLKTHQTMKHNMRRPIAGRLAAPDRKIVHSGSNASEYKIVTTDKISESPILTMSYECHLCKKPMEAYEKISIHMRTHTGFRPFQCYVCAKKFMFLHTFLRHIAEHKKNWKIRL